MPQSRRKEQRSFFFLDLRIDCTLLCKSGWGQGGEGQWKLIVTKLIKPEMSLGSLGKIDNV